MVSGKKLLACVYPGMSIQINAAAIKCLLVDDLRKTCLRWRRCCSEGSRTAEARPATGAGAFFCGTMWAGFLDMQMPDMDGLRLAELMRSSERTRHVPIIFVTAGAATATYVQGYESGAVDFICSRLSAYPADKAEVFFRVYRQKRQLAQECKIVRNPAAERDVQRLLAQSCEIR